MFLSSRLTHTPPSAFAGALLWHLSAPVVEESRGSCPILLPLSSSEPRNGIKKKSDGNALLREDPRADEEAPGTHPPLPPDLRASPQAVPRGRRSQGTHLPGEGRAGVAEGRDRGWQRP